MASRIAACSCGKLRVTCNGEAVRISICHCLACQRRTGAPFGAQSRFHRDQVRIEGESTVYMRSADSGNHVSFHFCPGCGSTVYWQLAAYPEYIAVALGMFADPAYPAPRISVWETTRHPWTEHLADSPMEHLA
ncbi:MAG TPA: GFA family protein [Steroidobacteraceae bacterium]|nr:GFA family protein [Steroidobacteraceae bacterium]